MVFLSRLRNDKRLVNHKGLKATFCASQRLWTNTMTSRAAVACRSVKPHAQQLKSPACHKKSEQDVNE